MDILNNEPGTANSSDSESLASWDEDEESTTSTEGKIDEDPLYTVVPTPTVPINTYSSDFALPEMDQCIVRVARVKNKKTVQVGI